MTNKYYIDTCVWRDFLENREGFNRNPLYHKATAFFTRVLSNRDIIILSSCVTHELRRVDHETMLQMLHHLGLTRYIEPDPSDWSLARRLSIEREVAIGDAIHAILANKSGAILVTQNVKDFYKFTDLIVVKRPEEITDTIP